MSQAVVKHIQIFNLQSDMHQIKSTLHVIACCCSLIVCCPYQVQMDVRHGSGYFYIEEFESNVMLVKYDIKSKAILVSVELSS